MYFRSPPFWRLYNKNQWCSKEEFLLQMQGCSLARNDLVCMCRRQAVSALTWLRSRRNKIQWAAASQMSTTSGHLWTSSQECFLTVPVSLWPYPNQIILTQSIFIWYNVIDYAVAIWASLIIVTAIWEHHIIVLKIRSSS